MLERIVFHVQALCLPPLVSGFHHMRAVFIRLFAVFLCLMLPALALISAAPRDADARELEYQNKPWKGDFDGMQTRQMVRVLVPYSRTLFYHDRGNERGVTATMVREFEKHLNRKYGGKGKIPITVAIIPTTREKLLDDLRKGLGDIAAGNITIMQDRARDVDFSYPVGKPFDEVLLSSPNAPAVKTRDDLAGKTVHVRPVTSYFKHLEEWNRDFKKRGLKPMALARLPGDIADEDVLEMVNAGLIDFAISDSWVAEVWRNPLPKMHIHKDITLATGMQVGWAVRKKSPLLLGEVNDFIKNKVNKQGLAIIAVRQAKLRATPLKNNRGGSEAKRFGETIEIFKKYGNKYGFDHLMLSAQGYQESRLDQSARSPVGAVGIMQVMPATGRDMNVGDIHKAEPNIHAGTKYMDFILANFFKDADLDSKNRTLFAFASYNAGPSRIKKLRAEAAAKGYDPDIWFDNVERIVALRVGQEPVTYVRNIYKYYVAYKLAQETAETQRQSAQALFNR